MSRKNKHLKIIEAESLGKVVWNKFVREHYPPIGAFMHTWEWGEFQRALGRKMERFAVIEGREPVALFAIVKYRLPMGFSYGYAPRSPVIDKNAVKEARVFDILRTIEIWAKKRFPKFLFLRLEPPLEHFDTGLQHAFRTPPYYLQPRFNLAVPLQGSEDEIVEGFHPSTRSNIRRAEKRGVTVEIPSEITPEDLKEFFSMVKDTVERTGGVNIYPSETYFKALLKSIPPLREDSSPETLTMGLLKGSQSGEPAGMHFVLFFGDTTTYLYGASYSNRLSSKIATYLHWSAMLEGGRRGARLYDLGGIDEKKWPSLTNFKRQFRGREFRYAGNLDISLRPILHRAYDFVQRLKKG